MKPLHILVFLQSLPFLSFHEITIKKFRIKNEIGGFSWSEALTHLFIVNGNDFFFSFRDLNLICSFIEIILRNYKHDKNAYMLFLKVHILEGFLKMGVLIIFRIKEY